MQRIRTIVIAILILTVGPILCGCQAAQPHTLGVAFTPASLTPLHALTAQPTAAPIVVEGEMIEKCPVAGCWFILKDKTGVVRVDTKSAGFVVSEVPLHSHLTVAGTLTPGAQPGIAATGVRY
jgi:hypothetical protein